MVQHCVKSLYLLNLTKTDLSILSKSYRSTPVFSQCDIVGTVFQSKTLWKYHESHKFNGKLFS